MQYLPFMIIVEKDRLAFHYSDHDALYYIAYHA